jgi:hypothetical protein
MNELLDLIEDYLVLMEQKNGKPPLRVGVDTDTFNDLPYEMQRTKRYVRNGYDLPIVIVNVKEDKNDTVKHR